jgi:pimeloyl-ACP methyl ester carboxylesterase
MRWTPWQYTGKEGFTLRGWHTGPSGKPLLHFIHGNGFCGRAYEPMLRHLARDFDLWLFDAQGHGDSDHGGRFVGWNRNADLAMEALRTQGGAFAEVPHYACGHSFGGVLTALCLGEHPRRFQRAVLLDPVLMMPAMLFGFTMGELTGMSRLTPLARQARQRRRHWPSRDDAFANLHGRGTYKGWTDEALRAFVDQGLKDDAAHGGVSLKCAPDREADIFSTGPDRLWSVLGRVRTPTLVLHATHTFPFVTESTRHWLLVNDAVKADAFEGGHCFMQTSPAQAAAAVRAFLLA